MEETGGGREKKKWQKIFFFLLSLNSSSRCKRIEGHACVARRVGVRAAGRLGFDGVRAAGGIEAVRRK